MRQNAEAEAYDKGEFWYFKPGPFYIYMFLCVNNLSLMKLLELLSVDPRNWNLLAPRSFICFRF